jgi:hypothetical protein
MTKKYDIFGRNGIIVIKVKFGIVRSPTENEGINGIASGQVLQGFPQDYCQLDGCGTFEGL